MPKYCPACGKQTLFDTDKTDYDAGDKYVCYSCGFSAYISVSDPIEYVAERGKVEPYSPLRTDTEIILDRVCASMVAMVFNRSFFEDKWREDAAKYRGETITFRRTPPSEA